MAYRIAMMAGTGIVVTIGATEGWLTGFFCASGILGVLFVYHLVFLPRVEREKEPIRKLVGLLLRKKPLALLVIVLLAAALVRWLFSLGWYGELKSVAP
ncbi:MAG: hypothetical protein JRI96_17490, partial [Deltaproteobacteria bacterium]|nr:hypothetical protein [Deltaproteobacteria bacterium]